MNIQFSPNVAQYTLPKSPTKTDEEAPVEKKTVKEVQAEERKKVLQQISEMQEAKKKTGEGNPRAQRILSKFNSGKKLSPEEIQYLMKAAPENVERVIRVSAERQQNEMMMRAARTKTTTRHASMLAINAIRKTAGSGTSGDALTRSNQIQDSVKEYTSTKEYKDKPNDELNIKKKKKSPYNKPLHPQESGLWATANHAYLKAKDLNNPKKSTL
ncbi:hypothetical protein [Psychrobacillus sp.]|uniref:hypothetical protein n=1 Tax=Psychrobacillus sp. TaxID=1871623 RepID=UPI0028BE6630|nr:hypothetical protein [Psychrobacillus sp.]